MVNKVVKQCHLWLTASITKSVFCAFHGLHEISIKLTRRRRCSSAEISFFSCRL